MKTAHIHVLFLLCAICVFGDADEVETVPAIEGGSVTLLTDVTEIRSGDVIEWRFNGIRIAKISSGSVSTFRDTLELDKQTGNLKIRNITATDSGLYKLKISSSITESSEKTFNVSVSADEVKSVSVLVGDTVTLHTDLTETQRYDEMQWRFERQNSPIAEISIAAGILSTHDGPDGRFRDRLKLDCLTGSLIIKNIGMNHAGVYKVTISISSSRSSGYTIHKSFSVTVSDVKSVSVTEGESVTLQTGVTEIQTDDFILWMFGDTQITVYDDVPDGRFRDRLKLDHQTGSLTITNTRTTDSGLYELQINSSRRTIHRRFTVTVSGSGLSSGAVVGIVVVILMAVAVAVAVAAAGVIYHRHRISELERQIQGTLAVTEGERVTLIHKYSEILKDDDIQLKFRDAPIAERKGENGEITVHDDVHDGIFKGRLKLDKDGSLTITDIRFTMSGRYELRIIRRGRESLKTFYVSVVQKTLVVIEGGSFALIHKDTEIRKDDDIQLKFEGSLIAERKGENRDFTVHDDVHDGIFKDRLKLDKDGSLTITDIRFPMSGRYELRIIRLGRESLKTFTVSVFPKADDMATVSVKEGDPLTLSSGVTEIQRDDQIQWKFGLENSPIAQIKGGTTETFPSAADGRFRDRLKLDQNGSLTIENIRPKDAGLYFLYNNTTGESMKLFRVDVLDPNDIRSNPEEVPLIIMKM